MRDVFYIFFIMFNSWFPEDVHNEAKICFYTIKGYKRSELIDQTK